MLVSILRLEPTKAGATRLTTLAIVVLCFVRALVVELRTIVTGTRALHQLSPVLPVCLSSPLRLKRFKSGVVRCVFYLNRSHGRIVAPATRHLSHLIQILTARAQKITITIFLFRDVLISELDTVARSYSTLFNVTLRNMTVSVRSTA